ncbi:Rap1a/Tai family immunity protein [Pseudomonas syringae]|uniref:Rap1a immunity protein domain-containing protein n=1 Tax=Pseudomonas syringae TaxID=317 RepID=A0A085VHT4_PSESX|nr:Rap1a/Tai family immunity protein [Pseudomonas syringae]KFE54997.1 hypothetical protein IV02_02960 [Pseudomonas syringae]
MKWMSVPLLALAVCLPLAAKADGNQLLSDCQQALNGSEGRNVSSPLVAGRCMGVIQGTIDGLAVSRQIFTNIPELICMPQGGLPMGQMVRVVTKHLTDNPADLSHNESLLIAKAMVKAFPCDHSKK